MISTCWGWDSSTCLASLWDLKTFPSAIQHNICVYQGGYYREKLNTAYNFCEMYAAICLRETLRCLKPNRLIYRSQLDGTWAGSRKDEWWSLNEEISYRINSPAICRNWIGFWRSGTLHGKLQLPYRYNVFAIGLWDELWRFVCPRSFCWHHPPLWHPHVELTAPWEAVEALAATRLAAELTVQHAVVHQVVKWDLKADRPAS